MMAEGRWRSLIRAVAIAVLMLTVVAQGSAQTDTGIVDSVPGQRVYDDAGALSADEAADLERRAEGVAQAGSPVVVYLRALHPDDTDTLADASALMDEWDVQSAPNARDGVVFFFNLEPDDLSHGEAGLVAGEQLGRDGSLPGYELERIYDDEMLPLLREGQLAGGIAAGLDAVERSLTVGPQPPPEPGAAQSAAARFARLPMNMLAIAASIAVAWYVLPRWQARPRHRRSGIDVTSTEPPSTLPPAFAGALVTDRVDATQAEATILDLARRGLLAIELEGTPQRPRVSIRLLEAPPAGAGHEQAVWAELVRLSDEDGVVAHDNLGKLRSRWGGFEENVRRELVRRGWFAPDFQRKRRPFFVVGIAALIGALAAFIVTVVGEELWGLIAVGLLGVVGLFALLLGASYPAKTGEGLAAAKPWLGYRDGLRGAAKRPAVAVDLDEAFPYAVAMGVGDALADRLKEAGAGGYVLPGFRLRQDMAGAEGVVSFYPYWVAFHAGISPSPSGTTGVPSTGAASGASTAGGRF